MAYKKLVLTSGSEDRLERLIKDRIKPSANKELIDRRIWDLFGEEWAVMFTDLSGFSRRTSKFGIIHFLQTIFESQRLLIPEIEENDGILLKIEGDSFLVIFRNPQKALKAALDMQATLREYNSDRLEEEQVLLCVGLGFGKVLRIGDEEVFGTEVNAASKLGEDMAKAYDVLVTENFKKMVNDYQDVVFEEVDGKIPGAQAAFKVVY